MVRSGVDVDGLARRIAPEDLVAAKAPFRLSSMAVTERPRALAVGLPRPSFGRPLDGDTWVVRSVAERSPC